MINFPHRPNTQTGRIQENLPLTKQDIQELSEIGALPHFQEALAPELQKIINQKRRELNEREPGIATPQQRRRRQRFLRFQRAHYEVRRGLHDGHLMKRTGFFYGATIAFALVFSELLMQKVTHQSLLDVQLQTFLVNLFMALMAGASIVLGWIGLGPWLIPNYYSIDPKMITPFARLRFHKHRIAKLRTIDLTIDAIEHLQAVEFGRTQDQRQP